MNAEKETRSPAQYFPQKSLPLQGEAAGVRMWAVALDNTMLTYFEIDAETRFEPHSHESEQITHVLEGVLYFEVGGETIAVGKGEVIALPSNVTHAAYTAEQPAKAVDAWSPVMPRYQSKG